jgi:hypothetical protein
VVWELLTSAAKQIDSVAVGPLFGGKEGPVGADMVEHPLGSPGRSGVDYMLAVDLVLLRPLAVANWPRLLGSSPDPRLAQCCPPWLEVEATLRCIRS